MMKINWMPVFWYYYNNLQQEKETGETKQVEQTQEQVRQIEVISPDEESAEPSEAELHEVSSSSCLLRDTEAWDESRIFVGVSFCIAIVFVAALFIILVRGDADNGYKGSD